MYNKAKIIVILFGIVMFLATGGFILLQEEVPVKTPKRPAVCTPTPSPIQDTIYDLWVSSHSIAEIISGDTFVDRNGTVYKLAEVNAPKKGSPKFQIAIDKLKEITTGRRFRTCWVRETNINPEKTLALFYEESCHPEGKERKAVIDKDGREIIYLRGINKNNHVVDVNTEMIEFIKTL